MSAVKAEALQPLRVLKVISVVAAMSAVKAEMHLSKAAEERGTKTSLLSMVCGNVALRMRVPRNGAAMPTIRMVFSVLSMDPTGHIIWPQDYTVKTAAALRKMAKSALQIMILDALFPMPDNMQLALTASAPASVVVEPSSAGAPTYRHVAVHINGHPTLVWGPWGGERALVQHRHVDQARALCGTLESKLRVALREVVDWRSNVEAVEAEMARAADEAERLRMRRAVDARSALKLERASAQRDANRARAEADAEVRSLTLKVASLERRLAGTHHVLRSKYDADLRVRDENIEMMQRQLDTLAELYEQCRIREAERETAAHHGEEGCSEDEDDGEMWEEGKKESRESAELRELKRALGVEKGRAVPNRSFAGDRSKPFAISNWSKRVVRHLVAVLADRGGEGEGIENIASALDRLGYLEQLVDCAGFRKVRKRLVQEAMDKWQLHWNARHALHVWDKLELSRAQFDSLRHLLSFVYNPDADEYMPIRVWEDPNDPSCCVCAAKITGRLRRHAREKLYHELAANAGILA
ncbi:hypothetical protein AB1Y20_016344 [Prymnesium parvum]|uniref:Uncharacterized protein n=1 Tax=Prymnesium parvum TaxID=97485 RepID=A0AB34IFQ4_PRYPA